MTPGESLVSPAQVVVTAGYFEAMGVKLAKGRFFDDRDTPTSPKSIIVDERLAQHFWPNQDPIGRRLYTTVGDLRTFIRTQRLASQPVLGKPKAV